ncbi:MAG: hypothetical protein KDC98_09365, partial [Planctomycetes bacterium]|nr:hypothetical protein [Planctomycetota bacterium]
VLGGNTLLFSASSTPAGASELWRTDGTAAGTMRVTAALAGAPSDGYVDIGNGRAFFMANSTATGAEPAITDGTAAGTTILADCWPGATSVLVESSPGLPYAVRLGVGDLVVFRARDGAGEVEPWLTDGTPGGTNEALDIWPGSGAANSSAAVGFTAHGAQLFFRAADGAANGEEPWVLGATHLGGTLVEEYGVGCAGIAGIPRLSAVGAPTLGNTSFAVSLTDAAPSSPAMLLGDFQTTSLPFGACTLLVPPTGVPIPGSTDANGDWLLPFPIPNGYLGLTVAMQGFVLDSAGSHGGLASFSNGLRLVLGN